MTVILLDAASQVARINWCDFELIGAFRHRDKATPNAIMYSRKEYVMAKKQKLIPSGDLERMKGIKFSKVHLQRLTRAGKFPQPVRIGMGPNGRVAYVEEEIDKWIAERCAERVA